MNKLNQSGIASVFISLAITIAAIGIIGVVAKGRISNSNDRKYFINLTSNLDNISKNIANSSSRSVKVEKVNNCYRTEQGPFDNGNPWCFVNQVYYVSVKDSTDALEAAKQLTGNLEREFNSIGFHGDSGEPYRGYDGVALILKPSRQMRDNKGVCNFSLYYPTYEHVPYYLPPHYKSDKEIQYYFSCGARTSAKVFEGRP